MENTTTKVLKLLNSAYNVSVTDSSDRIQTPPEITLPLRPHQAALVSRMYELEAALREGYEVTPHEKFFSRFAILGDAVGSGKSLVVLSFIAHIKMHGQPSTINPPYYHPASTPITFSFVEVNSRPARHNNLLIVPHTLYRQWMDYCKKQTTLNIFFCKTKKAFNESPADVKKQIEESDLTLVTNTLYTELQIFSEENGIAWERCFIDEVDTMYIPSTRPPIQAKFTWLITATWHPILKHELYVPTHGTYGIENNMQLIHDLHSDFRALIEKCIASGKGLSGMWDSWRFFKQYHVWHPYRYHLMVRTSDEFRKSSINAPPIVMSTIRCKADKYVRILSNFVTPDIQMALHAGDMESVLSQLGIQSSSASNLINGVTQMHQKELQRLTQTLEFKKTLEYATLAAKEAAIKALEEKIESVNQQINSMSKRIQENNLCYICYDDLTGREMVVPCCHNVFCSTCILMSLTHRPTCPFCRTNINASELCYIGKEVSAVYKEKPATELLTKIEALLKLLTDNPDGKFIVFSRYDNPFITIQNILAEKNIRVEIISGNKDQVYNIQERFRTGSARVLLLNSQHFCSGMNLESASHVILYHAGMSHTEEEQIIGRAYRMGRVAPLNVVRLLHEGE